jgi:hypothetical protein
MEQVGVTIEMEQLGLENLHLTLSFLDKLGNTLDNILKAFLYLKHVFVPPQKLKFQIPKKLLIEFKAEPKP